MSKSQIPCPSEAIEQTWLFRWASMMSQTHPELKLLFHCPNGGSRNKIEAHNLKMQGVRSGVPDICLPVPAGGYHGLFIELKRRSGGQVSDNQREWIKALRDQGYRAEICKGFDEAVSVLEEYIGIKKG